MIWINLVIIVLLIIDLAVYFTMTSRNRQLHDEDMEGMRNDLAELRNRLANASDRDRRSEDNINRLWFRVNEYGDIITIIKNFYDEENASRSADAIDGLDGEGTNEETVQPITFNEAVSRYPIPDDKTDRLTPMGRVSKAYGSCGYVEHPTGEHSCTVSGVPFKYRDGAIVLVEETP